MAYRLAGAYAATCSCAQLCPCPVDGTPLDSEGKGECRGAIVFNVREGNLDEMDLSGVTFALLNYFPANVTAGNWKVGFVVDEAASDDQARAVERILSGDEGGPFGDFKPLIGEFLGMERASVSLSGGETPAASVGDSVDFAFEPHRGVDGAPTTVKNAMFGFAPEYTVGKAPGRGDLFGISFEGRYGEAADFEFSTEAPAEVRGRA